MAEHADDRAFRNCNGSFFHRAAGAPGTDIVGAAGMVAARNYFAVTVAPEFRATKEARQIRRRHRIPAMTHLAVGYGLARLRFSRRRRFIGNCIGTKFRFQATCMSAPALLPLTGNPGIVAVLIPTILLLAVIFSMAPWWNKGRAPSASERTHAPAGDGTFEEQWKLGMFYFNPDDPALFVEKGGGSAAR
jgi:hypothetical protein